MPSLFEPYSLKSVTLRNRIVASPMCQYQAHEGAPNNWHHVHYPTLARGGASLVILEATAVSREGRITLGDLGLWTDEHVDGFKSLASFIRTAGAVPGIQLAHAGRKGGSTPPWEGGAPLPKDHPDAWTPSAPSAVPYMPAKPHVPHEMTLEDIRSTQQDFVQAARRAHDAGFEWLELHFAHGYLGQQFFSPRSNVRTDRYGGSLENRARFLIETVTAVRTVWPDDLPLTVRLGVVEFDDRAEQSFEDALQVLAWLKDAGMDMVDVGLGLATPAEQVPWTPNLLVPYANRIRAEVDLPVSTSWLIKSATDADAFVRDGKVDLIYLARTLLANPHWPYEAARELRIENAESVLPLPYAHWLKGWSK